MIYYIGYYTQIDNKQNRKAYLSAVNKMQYIIDTISKSKMDVQIVSCCMTNDNKGYSSSFEQVNEYVSFKDFRTFGRKNIFTKLLDLVLLPLQLFIYLLKSIKSDDVLLVYHSVTLFKVLSFIKMIKKCKVILEVEEIYGDVANDQNLTKKEMKFFNIADGYVFPTKLLNDKINIKNKPYVLIHGTYQVEPSRNRRFASDSLQKKIHCVYAGTLDPRKGGGAAVEAAKYLPENYHIHLLGFGSEQEVEYIKKLIDKTALESKGKVSYDGCLKGEDYIQFIQSCDIGLSTQDPNAAFNSTSFPSKILSYMSNGLRVVSIRIPAIESSAIGDYMFYYKNQVSEEIARAIKAIDFNTAYDGRKIISQLHEEFSQEIIKILR